MKTTALYITTLIAVIGLAVTTCANPAGGGNEQAHEHTWGAPVSVLSNEVITFPDDKWIPAPPSIPEGEPHGPLNGVALRYGTGITIRTNTYTCQECGETKEETETITRTYDFTELEDKPANIGLFDRKTLYSHQVIQDGKIVDRDTLEWNAWTNTPAPITGWLEKQDIDSGNYDNLVDTNGNPFTPGTSHQYQLQQQERTHKTDSGRTETRWVKVDERTITNETLSGRNPAAPAPIDTVAIINEGNSSGGGVFDNMNDSMAGTILKWDLLPNLSEQAKALQDFFADSTGNMFDDLENAENEIRKGVNGKTVQSYVSAVAGLEAQMIGHITQGIEGQQLTAFNTLWNGYKAGHYLVTRDWRTINGEVHQDKLTAYQNAYKLTHNGAVPTGGFSNNRGVFITNMDSNPYTGGLKSIEDELVTTGAAALAVRSITGDKASDMVRALIIQLGQDHIELKVFYDDLAAMPTTFPATLSTTFAVTPTQPEISTLY